MASALLSPDHLSYVCQLVRKRSAIELDANKAYLIEARLGPLAKKAGCESIADLVTQVRTNRMTAMEERIVEAMTTNETSFYRDIHPFEALKGTVLPAIIQSKASKALNIWSAACSTGQEIYSIAMLIREHFPQLAAWKVRLLGTDLSTEVIEKAKAAKFSQIDVNRGLSAVLLAKYFQREGLNWKLQRSIADMAEFLHMNLIESWPKLPTMDVVFLRNVLIYFPIETKKAILQRLRTVMAPNSVLFLGAAETTINIDTNFKREQVGNSVFYRLV